jgi:hypothetical protein
MVHLCVKKKIISGKRLWQQAEQIEVIQINRTKYIRTDGNNRTSDFLGQLPEM